MQEQHRKKGPGRNYKFARPFTEARQAFIDAMRQNPVNRLSGKELRQLEKRKLTDRFSIWAEAQRIIDSRQPA